MRTVAPEAWMVLADVPGWYADASIAVDVRIIGDTRERGVGIACRLDGQRFYRLQLHPDNGTIDMWRTDGPGPPVSFVRGRTSPAIRTGSQPNRLELSCVGPTISARVNGVEVASFQDSMYSEGGMWIVAHSSDRSPLPVEARFDNLVITQG